MDSMFTCGVSGVLLDKLELGVVKEKGTRVYFRNSSQDPDLILEFKSPVNYRYLSYESALSLVKKGEIIIG